MAQRKIKCVRCGNEVIATGTRQKYCRECESHIVKEKAALFREAIRAARESGKGTKKKSLVKPEEPKLKHIKCKKCGADVVVSAMAWNAKYCPKCASEERSASQRRSKERRKRAGRQTGGETVTTICNSCGREFSYIYRGYYKTLCGECTGANCGAGGPKKLKAKKKPHVSRIDEIQRAAQAAGMSYGKYKAMMEMQKAKKGA